MTDINPDDLPPVDLASEAKLAASYRRIPAVPCRGLCQESCGPIAMSSYEAGRMARAARRVGVPVTFVEAPISGEVGVRVGDDMTCPLLVDGRCSVYQARPAICRAWGATRLLRCPWGCTPAFDVADSVIGPLVVDPLGERS